MIREKRIGIVGAGSIAEAIIQGLTEGGVLSPAQIFVSNRTRKERLTELANRYGIEAITDHSSFGAMDILILAMKPKDVEEALLPIAPFLAEGQLLLSVVAAAPFAYLLERLGRKLPIIRAMPNTSSAVGLSATALAKGPYCSEMDVEDAEEIFRAIGSVTWVKEEELDAVTALSGSGPAFIYFMVEAMEEAGLQMGLGREAVRHLTLQTLLGSAHMLTDTGEEPSVLRQKIMSPAGTTIAGLEAMKELRFTEAVKEGIFAAWRRSMEIRESFTETNKGEIEKEQTLAQNVKQNG